MPTGEHLGLTAKDAIKLRFTAAASRSLLIPSLALMAGLGTTTPAIAAVSASEPTSTVVIAPQADDTPTPREVVGALAGVGDRVLDGDSATVTGQAAVSKAKGIQVTVPRDASSPVDLGSSSTPEGLQIGLPGGSDNAPSVVRNGVSVFTNSGDETAVAVNPLADGGAQFIVTIGGADSPTDYEYPVTVPDGATLQLTEDGGAEVVFADGSLAASIPAPWAVDSNQQPVPTHFRVVGNSLVQVVSHSEMNSYPVVADPSVFYCDWGTHICMKSTKGETATAARHINAGLGVGAAVCIAFGFAGGIPGAVCGVTLAVGGGLLADSISNAANAGKCIELHFWRGYPGFGALTHWKTEGC